MEDCKKYVVRYNKQNDVVVDVSVAQFIFLRLTYSEWVVHVVVGRGRTRPV